MTKKKVVRERKLEDLHDIKWKDLYLAGELGLNEVLVLKQLWSMRMTLKEIRNELAILNGGCYRYNQ